MPDSLIDKAIEIIQHTNDGDDLAPEHLKLVELAVNGYLNEKGVEAFQKLYENVEAGYVRPYFHGIEHLMLDHEGFVYWKGQHVEHYNIPWAYSDEGKAQALELAKRCQQIESEGREVNSRTAIWDWKENDERTR